MQKKRILWLIKLSITIFILVVLVNMIKLESILAALRNADKSYVFIAVLLIPVNLSLQVIKWSILLSTIGNRIKIIDSIGSVLVGMTLGLVTPGRIGEFARAFAIKDADNIRVLGLALIDKLYNLAWIALIGSGAILALPGMLFQQNTLMIIFGLLLYSLALLIISFVTLNPGFIRGILYSISLMLPKRTKIKGIISSFDGLTRQKSVQVFIISCFFYLTFIIQFFLLVNAFAEISPSDGLRGLPAIFFAKTFLPISIGGLGVGELASIRFLGLFDVDPAAAFNASLILFTINVVIPGIAGIFFIPKLRFPGTEK